LSQKIYAIIDIETTGGQATSDKITEIAIMLHDGTKIIDTFETLINPERSIPYYITQVTGISDNMVADAPKFYEVAKQIVKMTEGAIFVAHNVRFDYGFIQEEFRRLGFTYIRKQLCTVRLSRTAFPGLRSYSLGNLITHFNLKVTDRHRAMADVKATAQIFEKILLKEENIEQADAFINKGLKENQLPNGITLERLHQLPESCGVYYFHDKEGNVIYVGKSINIQKRIFEHFNDKTAKGDKLQQYVFDITFEETGSELVALLFEDAEIKKIKPVINKAQRKTYFPYCIYSFRDAKGYTRFHAVKNVAAIRKKNVILYEFEKLMEAKSYLKNLAKRYDLCEKLMEVQNTEGVACFNHQIGLCKGACCEKESPEVYNERANLAKDSLNTAFEDDFFILDKGRNNEERAIILIQNGHYYGYGYMDNSAATVEDYFEAVKKFPRHADTHHIIRKFISGNGKIKIVKI
jgi:DNA polymerase III subunit epsilon